jgi:hypothetical protein
MRIAILLALFMVSATPAWAITYQKASTQGSCASAASCTTSFASLPAVGNSVFVALACWNGSADCSISSITDNQSNSYSYTCQTDTAGNSQVCIGYDLQIGSPSGTFTVTANAASSTAFELIAIEYSPLIALDVTKGGQSSTGTADTGTSSATSQVNELSICVMSQSSSDSNINVTTPTGYTRRGVQQNAVGTIGFEASDKVLAATGTQQCTWSHDTVGMAGWAALVLTFNESGSFGILHRRHM